ncbi:MAG TPA: GAP family protein [Gaiellaceae bacterium]|nr:GAP family protein [Gaiellaceae bacterium]
MSKIFLFSLTAALNPTLLAATTVMLLLPRPKRLLLGYLLGAYTTTIAVGLAIVYWLSGSGTLSTTKRTVSPAIDITLGALALLVAVVVRTGRMARAKERRRDRKGADEPKKTPRWQRSLSKGSARDTFVVGLLLSFPGASYLAALTGIARENLSNGGIVLTVLAVTVVMLALLEIPLISYAVAPAWTPEAIERLKSWFRLHGSRAAVVAATLIGIALIIRGTLAIVT